MKVIIQSIWPYALLLGSLAFLVNYLEIKHRFYQLDATWFSVMIAIVFLLVGLWLGNKILQKSETIKILDQKSTPQQIQQIVELSKRENEVLQLLLQGKTNHEIAETLFLSISTVKTHTSNIYSKLGTRNRAETIATFKNFTQMTDNQSTT